METNQTELRAIAVALVAGLITAIIISGMGRLEIIGLCNEATARNVTLIGCKDYER